MASRCRGLPAIVALTACAIGILWNPVPAESAAYIWAGEDPMHEGCGIWGATGSATAFQLWAR